MPWPWTEAIIDASAGSVVRDLTDRNQDWIHPSGRGEYIVARQRGVLQVLFAESSELANTIEPFRGGGYLT